MSGDGGLRVVRGQADGPDERHEAVTLLDRAAAGTPTLRVWNPPKGVAFGRRDAREPGYDDARAAARSRGFRPVERAVGGRAVAHTGTTVAFALAEPTDVPRTGIEGRYERAIGAVERALEAVGVPVERGEPADAFCPGSQSLSAGGKLAGLAQRVRADAALVSGVVVVDGEEQIKAVLADVYDALGVPFDPESVGSVAGSGGNPDGVSDALVAALAGAWATGCEGGESTGGDSPHSTGWASGNR